VPTETAETPAPAAGAETVGDVPSKPGSDRYRADSASYPVSAASPHAPGPEAPSEQPSRPPSKARGGPTRGLILGAAALAAIAVGAFVLLSGGDGGDGSPAKAVLTDVNIPVPDNPVSVALAPEAELYVSSNAAGKLVQITYGGRQIAARALPAGGKQVAVAEDGSVWVASGAAGSPGSVLQYDPDNLKVQETFPVGIDPRGIALDGQFAWVANYGGGSVSRIGQDTSDTKTFPEVGVQPARVVQGDDSVWVSTAGDGFVTRFRDQGKRRDRIQVGNEGSEPRGMVFANNLLWVALAGDDVVTAIDPTRGEAGEQLRNVKIRVGDFPLSMAYGFGSLWVTNRESGTVSRIDPDLDQPRVVQTIPNVGSQPEGIAVDEGRDVVWVTVGGKTEGEVVKIDPTG
jgi:YVTN family beta-propeller protein